MNRIHKWCLAALGVVALSSGLAPVKAHAPLVLPKTFGIHKANTLALRNFPVSGSSRTFFLTTKTLAGATVKNTVLYTPLKNISGQFTGIDFYAVANGPATNYLREYPSIIQYGTANAFNNPNATGTFNFSLTNTISSGLPSPVSFINLNHNYVSGAQRSLLNLYGTTAAGGYNAGLNILSHPTGGLLYGTQYYQGYPLAYPGFYAFGNNSFVAAANASGYTSVNLTAPLQSYIQFGKFVRPISEGALVGTYYAPTSFEPPYSQPAPGPYQNYFKAYSVGVGSNAFNTLQYATYAKFLTGMTYFK